MINVNISIVGLGPKDYNPEQLLTCELFKVSQPVKLRLYTPHGVISLSYISVPASG